MDEYLTKKETAEILGRNERSVNNYAADGRLPKFYRKGKSGQEAVFKKEDVEKLLNEISSSQVVAAPKTTSSTTSLPVPVANPSNLPLQGFAPLPVKARPLLVTEMRAKMTLSLKEASIVGGLAQTTLKAAIEKNKIPSFKDGRKTLIRPEDLYKYIESLAKV